jgi:hypothetical protein
MTHIDPSKASLQLAKSYLGLPRPQAYDIRDVGMTTNAALRLHLNSFSSLK